MTVFITIFLICGLPLLALFLIIVLNVEGCIPPNNTAQQIARKYDITGEKRKDFYKILVKVGSVVNSELSSSSQPREPTAEIINIKEGEIKRLKPEDKKIFNKAFWEYYNQEIKPNFRHT